MHRIISVTTTPRVKHPGATNAGEARPRRTGKKKTRERVLSESSIKIKVGTLLLGLCCFCFLSACFKSAVTTSQKCLGWWRHNISIDEKMPNIGKYRTRIGSIWTNWYRPTFSNFTWGGFASQCAFIVDSRMRPCPKKKKKQGAATLEGGVPTTVL